MSDLIVEEILTVLPRMLACVHANLAENDPKKNPAKAVWLPAYKVRLEAVLEASRLGATGLSQLEKAWPEIAAEMVELGGLCYGEPTGKDPRPTNYLADVLRDKGAEFTEVRDILAEASVSPNHRPRDPKSIEALEMSLAGKSYREIADHQDEWQQGDDNVVRKGRIKNRIKAIRSLYEKYLPRK